LSQDQCSVFKVLPKEISLKKQGSSGLASVVVPDALINIALFQPECKPSTQLFFALSFPAIPVLSRNTASSNSSVLSLELAFQIIILFQNIEVPLRAAEFYRHCSL
jgi:hypothetical protein